MNNSLPNFTKFITPVAIGCTDKTNNERNDCAVRALANTSGKSYEECLGIFKQYGRTSGKGVDVRLLPSLFKEQGYTALLLGQSIAANYVASCNKFCSVLHKSSTIKTLLSTERYSKGKHVFVINGHAVAVVDGKLLDTHLSKANSRVFMIFTKIY